MSQRPQGSLLGVRPCRRPLVLSRWCFPPPSRSARPPHDDAAARWESGTVVSKVNRVPARYQRRGTISRPHVRFITNAPDLRDAPAVLAKRYAGAPLKGVSEPPNIILAIRCLGYGPRDGSRSCGLFNSTPRARVGFLVMSPETRRPPVEPTTGSVRGADEDDD